jgi:hypothetical protein
LYLRQAYHLKTISLQHSNRKLKTISLQHSNRKLNQPIPDQCFSLISKQIDKIIRQQKGLREGIPVKMMLILGGFQC